MNNSKEVDASWSGWEVHTWDV